MVACFLGMSTKFSLAWLLERAAQGELDGAEIADLRSRLVAEGRSLDEEIGKLRHSDRQILSRLPRETMGGSIRRRTETSTSPRSRASMLLRPIAFASMLGLIILAARGLDDDRLRHPTFNQVADHEQTVIKGDEPRSPRLLVYRQRPSQGTADSELLADGARSASGDLLQLAYDKAPEGLFGLLLSIDGAGNVTQHLPENGATQATPLTPLREVYMSSAYELDDAPDFERFVLVTASHPFGIGSVLEAAKVVAHRGAAVQTQPLTLAPGYSQVSVLLNKRGGTP
jgi:hypothetical protein